MRSPKLKTSWEETFRFSPGSPRSFGHCTFFRAYIHSPLHVQGNCVYVISIKTEAAALSNRMTDTHLLKGNKLCSFLRNRSAHIEVCFSQSRSSSLTSFDIFMKNLGSTVVFVKLFQMHPLKSQDQQCIKPLCEIIQLLFL